MIDTETNFKQAIKTGIPSELPAAKEIPFSANRAPKRKDILSVEEKKLAIRNALRYFPARWHVELAAEFKKELEDYGRIYMFRFKPDYEIKARPISD